MYYVSRSQILHSEDIYGRLKYFKENSQITHFVNMRIRNFSLFDMKNMSKHFRFIMYMSFITE